MNSSLNILCAGAVQGIVKALQQGFARETGAVIEGRFGAVGAMKEALLAGAPCDVMIVTDAMVADLQASGDLSAAPRAPLGRVRTGVAVREGDAAIAIDTPEALKASLLASTAIYFPDALRSTAGGHFAKLLVELGIHDEVESRLRTFPNGATAMHELGTRAPAGSIGCTQITEINYTAGIRLVGPLPDAFELATVYTAGIGAHVADASLARAFIDLLAGPGSRELRVKGGFEIDGAGSTLQK